MTKRRWLVVCLIAGGCVIAMRGGCANQPAPDEEVVRHLDKLCTIARDNLDTPATGVRHLGRYVGNHLDDILGAWGGTIGMIELIADDAKHDARARLARDRFEASLRACRDDWRRFADAVDGDPEATKLLDRAHTRLARTLEILFGDSSSLRDLPLRLEQQLLQTHYSNEKP